MTVKSGLIALSVLALVTLAMLVTSDDEAYRWVEQSPRSAGVTAAIAALGLIAAFTGRAWIAYLAAAVALVAAVVQFAGLTDGGLLGGNGSTFALMLAFVIGYAGLGYAKSLPDPA